MGVIIRGLGVWFGAQALLYFCSLVQLTVMPAKEGTGVHSSDYVSSIVIHFLIAAVLIASAEALCDLFYRGAPRAGDDEDADTSQ